MTTLLGHVAIQQKKYPLAKARYRESLIHLRAFGSPTYIAWCLEGCAAVLCAQERAAPAVWICAAAARMRQQAGTPLPDQKRDAFERVVARVRSLLGEQDFSINWSAGHNMTQGQVIEIALEELS